MAVGDVLWGVAGQVEAVALAMEAVGYSCWVLEVYLSHFVGLGCWAGYASLCVALWVPALSSLAYLCVLGLCCP